MYLRQGTATVADLAAYEPDDARAKMSDTGGRTGLRAERDFYMPLELLDPTRKGVAATRSCGKRTTRHLLVADAGPYRKLLLQIPLTRVESCSKCD